MLPYKCETHELVEYVAKEVKKYAGCNMIDVIAIPKKGNYKKGRKLFCGILFYILGQDDYKMLIGDTHIYSHLLFCTKDHHELFKYITNNIKTIEKKAV